MPPRTAAAPAPKRLADLLALSPSDLAGIDIARMNLICAEGLPGSENLDIEGSLQTLDKWAQHAKRETERNHHHFDSDPAYFYNSESFYKMLMLSVVAYDDFGIRYNPQKISSPANTLSGDDNFFADSQDILLHGLLGDRRAGTCSSMPVLYVALGRRLGYPLKLVKTKAHLFVRWESPAECFDLEATGKGMEKYDDAHFRNWPFPVSDQEIAEDSYLKSLSAAEELSVFLSIRAKCLTEARRFSEAALSFEAASRLAPGWKGNQVLLAAARQRLAASQPGLRASLLPPDVDPIFRQSRAPAAFPVRLPLNVSGTIENPASAKGLK